MQPRKLRLALAYAIVTAAAVPGIWLFFWCKTFFPFVLLHPTHWIWLIVAARILFQTLVSLLLLLPTLWAAFWWVSKILTPSELRYFNET
jgi:hypothetical protein